MMQLPVHQLVLAIRSHQEYRLALEHPLVPVHPELLELPVALQDLECLQVLNLEHLEHPEHPAYLVDPEHR